MSLTRRLELHEELCSLLGSRQCYFNPPMGLKLKYPCIVYNPRRPSTLKADNSTYHRRDHYIITTMALDPDNDLADRIADHFPYAEIENYSTYDNICHALIDLYY